MYVGPKAFEVFLYLFIFLLFLFQLAYHILTLQKQKF
jgi:hypothetical protein